LRKDDAHVRRDRFDDDGGDFAFVLRKKIFDYGEIIVGNIERQFGKSLWDAGAFGDAERGETGAGLGEKAVGMSVVAACKFDDQIASGKSASEAQGTHRGFCAAGNEADFFKKRNGAADALRKLNFEFGGDAEACSLLRLVCNRGDNGRMRVAEQHSSPGADEIEQPVAVRIEKILALAAFDDQRFATDGTKSAHGTVDAADENLFGFRENFARTATSVLRRGRGAHLSSGSAFIGS